MRNATFFRFPAAIAEAILFNPVEFDEQIADFALKPVGPLEVQSVGFVPLITGNERIPFWAGPDIVALVMAVETKILPAAAINRLVAEKLEKLEAQTGRKLGGKARRQLKEDTVHELLPRALIKPKRVQGYIDLKLGLCVIDTAGANAAEAFVSLIRQARGSFPALPLNAQRSMRAELSAALQAGSEWGPFGIGSNARFSSNGDNPRATLKEDDLPGAAEVQALIDAGMTPERVELYFGDSLRFDLDEDLRLRRLKMLDGALDRLNDIEADSLDLATEAQLLILTGELRAVYGRLDTLLQFGEAG